ncbi:carboxymuconolactone decarboxylase family protein [Paradesertivirga mongoliensis]|uniref:Carboxymuconolactone decarboxylase family protein n=1 Tax=Paradesertivirga mongoliensis TaxID=2100740 RepID=A0ABW4ZL32_9SPHI|nr:carboxymuconolactone decarboxylase family protein [Pedobacter mongoliensis]
MERITYSEWPEGLYPALKQVQDYIDRSGLDHRMLELMRTRVSQINDCAYCLDMHFKEAVHAGEDPIRLISVSAWRETPYYSPQERAVLEFAERLTQMRPEEDSADIHDKLRKYFSQQEIALLTLAVIQINSWNRLKRSFGSIPGKYKVGSH